MKYPFFSNWIAYKRIPNQDAYFVKDFVLDTENIVSSEMMRFAKKLDGKTNPYSIRGKRCLCRRILFYNSRQIKSFISR